MLPRLILIRFEPSGATAAVSPGTTLYEAARRLDLPLPAFCAGQGECGECRVTVLEGQVTPVTKEETESLTPLELKQGLRLACCTRALSQARVKF